MADTEKLSIPEEARKRMQLAMEAESSNRANAIDDLKFSLGEQWPGDMRARRELDKRPCLTYNKTDTFIRGVTNNMRQQRPQIRVEPTGGGARREMADVLEGLIRHIQVDSNADRAYDNACDFQVRTGLGYWRVNTEYENETSFNQKICVDAIPNPFTVYFDPSATEMDGSDAKWVIVTQRMRRSEFEKKYPNADAKEISDRGSGDDKSIWGNKHELIVADYYRIEEKAEKYFLLSNGVARWASEMPSEESMMQAGLTIQNQRDSVRRVVKMYKITATEVLSEHDIVGKYIPIVRVQGVCIVMDGETVRFGMVHNLRDPQMTYNFLRTTQTEGIALEPKAKWLVADGQIEGYEDDWAKANNSTAATLPFRIVDDGEGKPLPPPQRVQPAPTSPALTEAILSASDDMKAVAGMFDPALGAEGNETSGVMVTNRQQQSDLSNFHFYDNFTQSLRHTGRIILGMIPKIYDTQRIVRIIGEDNQADLVTLNEQSQNGVLNDVSEGSFDIVIDTGPSFMTKRQEMVANMQAYMTSMPQLGQVAGDIFFRNMDWAGSQQIADRLEAVNPIAAMDKQLPKDVPNEIRGMILQLQSQNKQLQDTIQHLQMEKAAKVWGDREWQKTEIEKAQINARAKERDTDVRALTTLAKEHMASEREVKAQMNDLSA